MKSQLFIFIGGSDEQNGDYSHVHRLAKRGGTTRWSSLKDAKPGDRALIYIQSEPGAIIAEAEVLGNAVKSDPGDYAYRVKTGQFRLLQNPVTIRDLKRHFPNWGWLRYPRSKAVVPPEYEERLLKLVNKNQAPTQALTTPAGNGAGFGDAKTNRLVEQAAVRKVKQHLQQLGYVVHSRERECIGYDLDANKGGTELHIEVKGISGRGVQFPITVGEVTAAERDPAFRLMVVTEARLRSSRIHVFNGATLKKAFTLKALSYLATLR